MTTSSIFNAQDVSTWTYQSLKTYVEISNKYKPKAYFRNFFGWTTEEAIEATEFVISAIGEQSGGPGSLPGINAAMSSERHLLQTVMVRNRPDLFVERHGPNPPEWFTTDLIYQKPRPGQSYSMKCVTQQFISSAKVDRHNGKRRRAAGSRADEDDDGDGDESRWPLSKRRHSSQTTGISKRPATTSSQTMLTSSVASSRLQSKDVEGLTNGFASPNDDKKELGKFVPTGKVKVKTSFFSKLVLYITRVTIVNQQLILERDHFGLAKNLFDQGVLSESRLQELVFGNGLQDKPVFLWYFHKTSNDKPRAVRSRPSAEAAITLLMAHAEESGAEAIQIFDAPDRDTASLIPAHEVTREKDFRERESFELEIDGENEDDDAASERASRVDSA
ncbi:hypothetical protein AUEXF2481DRAFT_26716 [Aureobasidium subglaciale EXF-2481]|uniref:Uncharacterized protein n=1 Tax=Aureobasidium subglaciale (strain EXF-2481) TaxID=1043005 RepID=A0A074YQ92_AURSE|nr:uncharacterized protein AUEXF2481DRAFT_26716 [Aureobasidium subglaciale EXF-2481]KEQ98334.1 hypothetical protein AUEXF2481DRAFT_26716 [Aureobasidium subglaciale EXF-2481]